MLYRIHELNFVTGADGSTSVNILSNYLDDIMLSVERSENNDSRVFAGHGVRRRRLQFCWHSVRRPHVASFSNLLAFNLVVWGQDLTSINRSVGTILIVNTDRQGRSFYSALPAAGPFKQ